MLYHGTAMADVVLVGARRFSMPDAAGAPAAPAGAAGAAPTFRDRAMYALRSFVVYAAVMQLFGGFSPRPAPGALESGGAAAAPPARLARPLFSRGEPLDAHVFVTYDARFRADATPRPEPLAIVAGLPLATEEATVEVTHAFSAEARARNATPHLHVAFARAGASVHEADDTHDPVGVFVASAPLLRFYPAKETKARKRLLASDAEAEKEETKRKSDASDGELHDGGSDTSTSEAPFSSVWLPFFSPNVTVSVVDDFAAYPYPRGIPESMRSRMTFEPTTDAYFPTAYVDDFWVLRDKRTPLDALLTSSDDGASSRVDDTLPLHVRVTVAPQSAWKWQVFDQMERSFAQQRALGTAGEGDADEMKRVLLESDPRLLFVTGAVSLAHMVLETLAFKSDVSFWRAKKSTEGLSARTIVFNAGCQVVVLLYLLDNDTSWMVLLSTALSVVVEAWKITKVLDVTFVSASRGFVSVADKRTNGQTSGDEADGDDAISVLSRRTAEHDETAMRYLTYLLIPLVLVYAGYSVMYLEHRGWYSFLVTTLVGAVYAFGFLAMLPQLFINYKLKSVAHMPWRQMTYKALNTVIDDLFAFVIKMPTLHRVAVFRDDVVFAAFLYQRWIYRVDKSRVNEFGFAGEAQARKKSEDETKKER